MTGLGNLVTTGAIVLGLILLGGCSKLSAEQAAAAGGKSANGKPAAPRLGKGQGPPAEPPAPVTVADVVRKTIPLELSTFGTVAPNASVAVKSQAAGVLVGVHFQKGQDVKKGDLLFTIDPRPAEAAKKLAEANLARDTVQLQNAQKEAQRQKELLAKSLASQEAYERTQTAAESLAATVRAGESAIETVKLQLEYCSIRSPIDGRTGDLMVDQGNLVKANDVTLVTINQIKPLQVVLSVAQREFPGIVAAMKGQQMTGGGDDGTMAGGEDGTTGGRKAGKLPVRVLIPGQDDRPETGAVTFVDNAVDRTTGTIKLWAALLNDDGRLWPGQFVNVVLTLAVQADAVAVPSKAVQNGQEGTYVFTVLPDNTVEYRLVTVERTFGDDSIIATGLQAGERVVLDGQLRLKPKAKVQIKQQ